MLRLEGYLGRITLLSADESLPCDRPNLSKGYLAGTAPEESNPLRSTEFYQQHDIDVKLRARVAAIDAPRRYVELVDGSRYAYDALLLATGAEPVRLELPGGDLPHVHYLRTLADSRALVAQGSGGAAGRSDRRELHRARGGGIPSSAEYRSDSGRPRDMPYGEDPRSRCRQFHPQTP